MSLLTSLIIIVLTAFGPSAAAFGPSSALWGPPGRHAPAHSPPAGSPASATRIAAPPPPDPAPTLRGPTSTAPGPARAVTGPAPDGHGPAPGRASVARIAALTARAPGPGVRDPAPAAPGPARTVLGPARVARGAVPAARGLAAAAGGSWSSDEGTWRWPLGPPVPAVVRGFSPPASPWLPGHRGIDLAASPGDPVYAAGAGRVSYAGALAGRGVVAITHGTLRTTYLPVHPAVSVGRDVPAGARIGTVEVAQPPHCPQVCLHWGLLRGTSYLDPLALVRPLVRLLPLWQSEPAPPFPNSPRPPPVPSQGTSLPDDLHLTCEAPPLCPPRPPDDQQVPASARPLPPTGEHTSRHGVRPQTGHRAPEDDRPLRPALRSASTAAAGTLTCLVLALSLAFVRRARGRSRSRAGRAHQHDRTPPNVIDLAHERRLRRPAATHHPQ
ncbi:peptidoglycan DD-metalloendopeptidase family protein [Actinomadura gamaensis]|uniref:Peptidoglycan DD-metalloendopeptidase family protein n=1 Tax=Actinomadura gamaensis TaxID=1763541 RepID=A0ABV9TQN6_9ACTN